jgi:hypothetical protein
MVQLLLGYFTAFSNPVRLRNSFHSRRDIPSNANVEYRYHFVTLLGTAGFRLRPQGGSIRWVVENTQFVAPEAQGLDLFLIVAEHAIIGFLIVPNLISLLF